MKKLVSFALATLLLLSTLSGCTNNTSDTDNFGTETKSQTQNCTQGLISDINTTESNSQAPVTDTERSPDTTASGLPDTAPNTTPDTTASTSPDTAPDTTPDTTASASPDTAPDTTKDYMDAGVYASVLSSKAPYYEDEKEHYVSENKDFQGYDFSSYALLDMDGDGEDECLLSATQIILVLHRADNVIYGYTYGFRGMDSVYENGTFGWHGFGFSEDGGQSYGLSKIRSFTPTATVETRIWRVDNDGEENVRYYIGEDNKQVTKAEFDEYVANYYPLKEIAWNRL